jgi:hypothetical protein
MDKQFANSEYELITQLLDGELSDVQAAEVRQMIAQNPELQLEFDQQSEIRNAVQKDRTAFVPPRSAKDNVFLALGIPLAVGAPAATTIVREGGNLVPIISALAASVMTFSLHYGLNSNIGQKSTPAKNNIPVVSSFETAKHNNLIILDESKEVAETTTTNSGEAINQALDKNIAPNVSNSDVTTNSTIASQTEPIATNLNQDEEILAQSPNERVQLLQTWGANIITSKNKAFNPSSNIFLQGNELTPTEAKIVRDYLTVIRTTAGSSNLNNGSLDVSFLTNYIFQDVRGIMSAGLSWYDNNSATQLRNPVFLGGGLEYTPTFTKLLSNEYFDTFVNGQLFIGKTPSYKLGAGLSTHLGGLMNMPLVIGYYKTYTRDYQFIQLESGDGFFLGTEISF